MILLEFAAQGIRGVAPAGGRATLRPGYNVVSADGAALRRLLEALLYPDPRDGDTLPRAGGGPAGAALKAGLTLVGNDRVTYRLVRDFAAGAQLHRFDAEKRSFALVAQELAQIAAFLKQTAGAPPPARFGSLLSVAAAELPSRAGGGGGGGGGAASLQPARATLSPEQARRRIAQLEAERAKAGVAEKIQFQLDGLQSRAFKLDELLRSGAQVKDGLARAEQEREQLEAVAAAVAPLGDAAVRLAAYERASQRYGEAAAKLEAERAAVAEADARGAPPPFWTEPRFWAGAGGGLALAVVAALGALTVSPSFRYLALLDIPAFGWGAWVALQWVGALEGWERLSRRRRVLDDWEKKFTAQYEKDAAEVRAVLESLRLQRPSELKEALARLADADAVVTEWRRRVADWEQAPETVNAARERAEVDAEQKALEAKLAAEAGGFVRDVRSVEMEIQRLEAELAAPPPPPTPTPAPVRPAVAAGGASTEPLRGLLERAATELGGSPAAAGRAVAQKASQALSGLTFQRLTAVQVDDRGGLNVVTGGRAVPALTLPPADKDVVFLALKLAFVEQALAAGKQVAVLEDAFGALSDGGRRFAARLLKQAARSGQLVHATADPLFREAADHTA